MKKNIITLIVILFTINGFSQQIDKDGRAILTPAVIGELSSIINHKSNYESTRDAFNYRIGNNMLRLYSISHTEINGIINNIRNKTNRDMVLNAIQLEFPLHENLVRWGMSASGARAIEYYMGNGMGDSRQERANKQRIGKQNAAKEKLQLEKDDLKRLQEEKLQLEKDDLKRLQEEKQQQEIRLITSRVYDLEQSDIKIYDAFKTTLYNTIKDQIEKSNDIINRSISSIYKFSYSGEAGVIGKGEGKLTLVKGDSLQSLSNFYISPPQLHINDIVVPIRFTISDIQVNYTSGMTEIKVKDKQLKFKGKKPNHEIRSFISSNTPDKSGIYSSKYIYGDVSGSPIRYNNQKFIRQAGYWLIYPAIIVAGAAYIYLSNTP